MFDPVTADFVRSAAPLPGLDPASLVDELTAAYVDIAAARLSIGSDTEQANLAQVVNRMSKLADAYEAEIVLDVQAERRRAIAFVAASARQVLAQLSRVVADTDKPTQLSDRVIGAELSASLLFLIAQRSSDAYEASRNIRAAGEPNAMRRGLILALGRFCRGQFGELLEIDPESERLDTADPTDFAADLLFREILRGLHLLANVGLGNLGSDAVERAVTTFRYVQDLAIDEASSDGLDVELTSTSVFPGPHHLAALLEKIAGTFVTDILVFTPPPTGSDAEKWNEWLRSEAGRWPFLWENHRKAIATGYLGRGSSLVMTTPTGSGKTTLAALKIAATLACGKTVLYLAPTHALVGQVENDLNDRVVGLAKAQSIEDITLDETPQGLPDIAVVTPERCFALLNFAPQLFANVGLLVFDEFHLLGVNLAENIIHTRMDRRAIDAMLCLLTFQAINKEADYLLLSAMVSNGQEVARWLESLVGRPVAPFDDEWKPTRQLRSCVLYDREELTDVTLSLRATPPNRKPAARPYGLFSLVSGWHPGAADKLLLRPMSASAIAIGRGDNKYGPYLTANRYGVAAHIAEQFARSGLKVIVFCDSIVSCGSVARAINSRSETFVSERDESQEAFRTTAVGEVGAEDSIYDAGTQIAAVHHGELLTSERRLVETLFRRRGSRLKILAATSTLAQGLNLPCDVVILASTDRLDETDPEEKTRSSLEQHEILNALGRAGRAGQAATGYSIVIPSSPTWCDAATKAVSDDSEIAMVFAEGDQCLPIADPLTLLFDIIETKGVVGGDASYLLRRLAISLGDEREGVETFESLTRRTFGFYQRRQADLEKANVWLAQRKASLTKALSENAPEKALPWQDELAARTGATAKFIAKLTKAYESAPHEAMDTLTWMLWLLDQLDANDEDTDAFLRPDSMVRVFGRAVTTQQDEASARKIGLEGTKLALTSWFEGNTLVEMEKRIATFVAANEADVKRATTPDAKAKRARRFALRIAPDLGYLCGVLSQIAQKFSADNEKPLPPMLGFLPQLTRFGFETPYHYALWRDSGRGSRGATQAAFKKLDADVKRLWSDDWNAVRDKLETAQLKAMFSMDFEAAKSSFEAFLAAQKGNK